MTQPLPLTVPAKHTSRGQQMKGTGRLRVGVALGSGSARGWAHVGVLQGLAAHGIHPDVVCGSSIGSLVGAAYVTGKLDELESWVRNINWRQIARFADLRLSGGGLIEGARLVRFLRKLKDNRTIESLDIRFAAVAADLVSGQEVWLREGPVVDAVRASMALPGLLAPVNSGAMRLADGGLVNPVPVTACRALGADIIIAVNLNGDLVGRRVQGRQRGRRRQALKGQLMKRLRKGEQPAAAPDVAADQDPAVVNASAAGEGRRADPGYFSVIFGAINVMQDRITRDRLAADPPDVLIEPRLRQISLLEFNRAEEAIAEGRAAVEQALPALQEVLARVRKGL